ncbi:hypothetical protein A3Q56_01763 [Intoshia linei]|uniref:peptidyl-tRNA hydrolase n=1 Tax=Intoshia linei TaxID=1819745 RepID=A0A177BAM1_9BILA|nr:hypothetical protein A3Q56_01763 [Intoshia linei]
MVIVVRTDLQMSKGKIAAQVAHAAVNCSNSASEWSCELYNEWMISGMPKVVLKVKNEEELINIYRSAQRKSINCTIISDAGRTQIACGSKTVVDF